MKPAGGAATPFETNNARLAQNPRIAFDGNINGRDNDSNGDLHEDDEQVFVVFRTNATGGDYAGSGVWVAVPEIVVNVTASAPDLSASNALFRWDSTVQAPQGTPYQVTYKGIPRYVFTPDGRAIFYLQNGTNDEVFTCPRAPPTQPRARPCNGSTLFGIARGFLPAS